MWTTFTKLYNYKHLPFTEVRHVCFPQTSTCTRLAKFLNWGDNRNSVPGLAAKSPSALSPYSYIYFCFDLIFMTHSKHKTK